ncbi:MAG: PAS domain-containing sensor histidine kinase [Anaerolineae bacterium]|nr:PAS domain-containing sensor histidine kinase [Anaerolineae bacterium]
MIAQVQSNIVSADRAHPERLLTQADIFTQIDLLPQILDAVDNGVVLLNRQRQIVFINETFARYAGIPDKDKAIGLRPGEAMGCYHALESPGGCGTSDYCRACGALVAILMAQKGQTSTQECRISRHKDDHFEALDLRITATPLPVQNERLTVFSVTNIADEKRRQVLEGIFFHDLRNTVAIINSASEMISMRSDSDPFREMLNRATMRLLDEIEAQEQLLLAENGSLGLNVTPFITTHFLTDLVTLYEAQAEARECDIHLHPKAERFMMTTDPAVLGRVVGNMIKNALEACEPGETVTVGCGQDKGKVRFWVHNPAHMPHHVQRQVFKRSFSTKGSKRGLGTYSMRLLSERYLGSKVSFVTHKTEGTTFSVVCPVEAFTRLSMFF